MENKKKNEFSKVLWVRSQQDEYFTPKYAVDIIVPFLKQKKYKKILCPFDSNESNFTKVLRDAEFEVDCSTATTLTADDNEQNFMEIPNNQLKKYDCIVSNPPFSSKTDVLTKLYEADVPFAMLFPMGATIETKTRNKMFKEHGVEMLIPNKRISFWDNLNKEERGTPTFTTCYFCKNVLPHELVFCEIDDPKNTGFEAFK